MDQPGLDESDHAAALRGLATINRFSRARQAVWQQIKAAATALPDGERLRVLDLACGGGDFAQYVAERARRESLDIDVAGCDISLTAVNFANESAEHRGVAINFFVCDLFGDAFPTGYDVITCNLFLHHLERPGAVELMRSMTAAARQRVIVCDLRRSRLGYALAWAGTRILSRSPIVHNDGPLSVKAAFQLSELPELCAEAGITEHQVRRVWPQRFVLTWPGTAGAST
ncbi:hypothetical protein Pan189_32220 [Stratiformator vulcanicus]|uniref:Methyltransferase domain-containing protein n=2 Tax=Stratiformator vulcanicus TaxID=2527980 RepID=A0A517R4S0_9PLAN|nr:hypothetical protein Pan189_32220 [Stratiformator vulcanicus]